VAGYTATPVSVQSGRSTIRQALRCRLAPFGRYAPSDNSRQRQRRMVLAHQDADHPPRPIRFALIRGETKTFG
jgi:hypothetical protein